MDLVEALCEACRQLRINPCPTKSGGCFDINNAFSETFTTSTRDISPHDASARSKTPLESSQEDEDSRHV